MMNDQSIRNQESPAWEIESCPCSMCGLDEPSTTPYSQPPFKVVRCSSCEFWYLSPRLTASEARRFYESDSYFGGDQVGYSDYDNQERSLRKTFRKLLSVLSTRAPGGNNFLEVGCGPGFLLDEATPHFENLFGVELSPPAAERARQKTGAQIYLSVDEIPDSMSFDWIVATHVIEHIYEPVDFVKNLAGRLSPGGHLVLAAPDMGSWFRKTMGKHWPSFKYPEHVSFFDDQSLPRLLRNAGMESLEPLPYPHDFPFSLVLSKLGIPAPAWSNNIDITMPATTVCYMGRRPEASK